MDPLTMMMLGSTALSGIGSLIGGNKSAKAAEEAARLQYQREQQAISGAKDAGAQFKYDLGGYSEAFDPYIEGGDRATNQLYKLLGLDGTEPENMARRVYEGSPGHTFRLNQGVEALDRSATARGMLNSGRQSKDLIRFGQGLADSDYDNYLGNLFNLSNRGYSATGAKTNTLTRGAEGPFQAGLLGAQLGFRSAATEPQGMIASQNAENAGLSGALGALNYGVGQVGQQDTLSKMLGNTSRGSSFGTNFQPSSSPFSFGAGNYTGMGPFLP